MALTALALVGWRPLVRRDVLIWAALSLLSLTPWALHAHRHTGHAALSSTNSGMVAYITLGQLPDNPWGVQHIDGAAGAAARPVTVHPNATRPLNIAAWTVIAHASFDLEDYQQLSGELACARIGQLDEVDVPTEDDATSEMVFDVARREALVAAIGDLPEKEGLMLSLYYTEGLNLKEIGLVLGVSESRVSQIHGQAVARLRSRLTDWT